MRLDAVIFDMDGVLLESEPLHHAVVNSVLARDGVAPIDDAAYRAYLGTTDTDTWRDLIARYDLPRSLDVYLAEYDAEILAAYRAHSVASPGVTRVLDHLAARDVACGVASGSRRTWVETALGAMGLTPYFRAVITGDMVERGKPDPEIFVRTARVLAVEPEHCLVFEDAPKGIAAARGAGMRVVAVRTPYATDDDLRDADALVDTLAACDASWWEMQ